MRRTRLVAGACGCVAAAAVTTAAAPSAADPDPTALAHSVEGKLRFEAAQTLRAAVKTAVHKQRAATQRRSQQVAVPAVLQSIAQCESSGDPTARSGPYGGLFQFDQQTWASVGGTGDPAAASPAEQEQRAAILYQQRGTQAWPVCGAGK